MAANGNAVDSDIAFNRRQNILVDKYSGGIAKASRFDLRLELLSKLNQSSCTHELKSTIESCARLGTSSCFVFDR